MPNYANGKIYRIRNRADDDRILYIGSTTQPLCNRMSGHRCDAQRGTRKIHQLLTAIGIENAYIELICNFPCINREMLLAEEGRHIRLNNTVNAGGNMNVAGRDKCNYYIDNRDLKLAQRKTYRDTNPEKVKACKKASSEAHAETDRAKRHEAYVANKEQRSAKARAYRAANLDKVREQEKAGKERGKARRLAAAAALPDE